MIYAQDHPSLHQVKTRHKLPGRPQGRLSTRGAHSKDALNSKTLLQRSLASEVYVEVTQKYAGNNLYTVLAQTMKKVPIYKSINTGSKKNYIRRKYLLVLNITVDDVNINIPPEIRRHVSNLLYIYQCHSYCL